MAEVKITVIKRMRPGDVFGDNLPCQIDDSYSRECPRLNLGDEFVVPEDGACPAGFCGWAFADIHPVITHFRKGGILDQCKDGKIAIACCTDGVRPVFFKVERMGD